MTEPLSLLYRSTDVVVVSKPAALPTEPPEGGGDNLRDRLSALLAVGRGGRAPHAVSRLDTNVTGAVVFALSADGARRLEAAKAAGAYRRVYVALAHGELADAGVWRTPVDGAAAESAFHVAGRGGPPERPTLLVGLLPRTGRTHQLRIHASGAGSPLAGDRKYGGPSTVPAASGAMLRAARPMLHAAAVGFPDANGAEILVRAAVPADMAALWSALDGRPEAWEEALGLCGVASSSPPL